MDREKDTDKDERVTIEIRFQDREFYFRSDPRLFVAMVMIYLALIGRPELVKVLQSIVNLLA